jgi:RHS repeat-associated protein
LGNYTVHTFNALYAQDYCPAYESQTQYFQNGGTLLKTVNTTFSFSQGDNKSGPMNVVPIQITTVLPNGLTSTVTKSYDSGFTYTSFKGATGMPGSYGRLLSESASDYGSSAAGPTLRTTKNSYLALSNSNYLNANLLGLVSSKSVVDGSNCKQAETDYTYDESSYLTTYAGTLPSGSHNSPPNSVRGNLTTATRQLFSAGTCPTSAQSGPTTHTNWYDTGEIYQAIDAMGNATTHSYDSAYAGAFSTKTCNALSQCVSGTYDANTGLLTSFTDQNGSSQASGTTQGDPNHTSNFSYDSMWRMIQALSPPDPTGARPETDLNYPDATTVQHCKKQNSNSGSTCGTGWIVSYAYFDGVGRKKQTRLVDPAGDDFVDTTYAADGRASTVSNPHRSASSATDGTTTQYDGLSRVTQVTKQDGSISSVQYDLAAGTTNCTLSTDEAGKQRKTCSDGLGRLTRVFEDPAGLNYETDYQYDTLGNLLQVNQKGSAPGDSTQWRTRTFTYDSLSRLLTTNNPESGQISYAYDANGNVLSKSDARGTSFSYEYDVLNRLRFSTPSDGTPIVEYVYDQTSLSGYAISNGIGRMTTEYTFPAWGQQYIQAALFNYDALGHMTTELDCLPSTCPSSLGLTISATYDLVGEMTSLTYPDGQKVNYTYDAAAHALSAIGADNTNYTYNATYWPNGAQYRQWWSPNIYGRTDLNNRLQVAAFYSDNGVTPSYYLSKTYSYSTQNNGNVLEIYNNKDTTRNQSFTYDSLNRLTHAENGGTDCTQVLGDGHTEYWGNNYVYDAWGNLYQKNVTKCSAENMQATVTAQNRFTGSSYSYDANGNLLYDGLHHYTYDGENRITQVDSGATSYLYDADGSRVKKTSANLSATEYVDFGGNVIAERSTIALSASMLSQSGLSGYNPGQITDGSTACCGWHTDTATAGAWLQVDLGAGNQTAVTQASIYPASAAYTGNTPGNYSVQYSDDASTWSTAATNFVPSQAGWNSIIWASVGVHRYWRLYLTNTPGTGPWLNELQLLGETNYMFFNGKRVARHDPSGAVHYYLSDHLGSTTMVVSAAGAIENESDYYPWGGELKISAADAANHYKFTGKERDTETGNDYFGARYNSSSMGRFLTPDPLGGEKLDPQTLNKYSYVRNNPINRIDPTGLYTCKDQADCKSKQDVAFEKARQQDLKSKDADVVRAAKAYGDPTKDNHVSVGFADLDKKGEGGNTVSTLGADDKGNFYANSDVTINSKLSGSDLNAAVGHEGSHVADAQDVAGSISIISTAPYTKVGMDISRYSSEQRAYAVSDSILRSENTSEHFACGLTDCILGRGLTMQSQVPETVDRILQNSPLYRSNGQPLSPTNQGGSVINGLTVPH